ncbi:EAL domain-containing protein [Eubacterium barkeri]|uniref:Stage 0 sporulation protein A homolog n=1 Tax=Eubacterium barkeri TaxID=1528 RepID=A0A1H3GJR2_EUBBA|nr:EAL domain-containing protein [Eubacterium barkeri]SDY03290.1 PAS domain S-box-containing protein/diguanylate cyclase (GGDEF) domain-containing protein [Eubacterium barkeri]
MKEQYTVLIVDDNAVNRKILVKILENDYLVMQAENGKQALDVLETSSVRISAVLLDLVMPVMDGYTFLGALQKTSHHDIPVIVTTGNNGAENEKRAFDLGALDFVSKPYDAQILKYRLQSAITRSQYVVWGKMKYLAEHDPLTGLYNQNKFFEETWKMILEGTDLSFAFVRLDMDRFSLVNTFFGNEAGDRLLQYIASYLKSKLTKCFKTVTYGRIEGDEFAFCCAYETLPILEGMVQQTIEDLKKYPLNFETILTFGIYLVTEPIIPVRQMLDNANLSAKKAKGHFSHNYAFYDKAMGDMLVAEQEIINDMSRALEERQFCIYLQPKYDLYQQVPAGAEALVRWIHPEKGMISPGAFIPVFEKNGFIAKLDYYVWEETCQLLESMRKRNLPILPISVNVSRVHLYNPKLPEVLCEMLDRHHLPHELINLELTESIYTEHPSIIQDTIAKLHDNGFIVMMDDFGSGYSSLNVLKDVEFDVLKIDMIFFEGSAIKGRQQNIIASIIRMAKWLGLPIIAEGVETLEQVTFLRDMGCECVQGYYFARPMPAADYEVLLEEHQNLEIKGKKNTEHPIHKLWKDSDQVNLMFSVIPEPLVIFEVCDDKVELLRVNQEYYDLFGHDNFSNNSLQWEEVLSPTYKKVVQSAVNQAIENQATAECIYLREYPDGSCRWIQVHLRYINRLGKKHHMLGVFRDLTTEWKTKETLENWK